MTHMPDNTLTIRKTPFLFLRLLVFIEFFFAFLPIMAAMIFPFQDEFDQTALAQSMSYSFLFTLILTTLQILIVAISFFSQ